MIQTDYTTIALLVAMAVGILRIVGKRNEHEKGKENALWHIRRILNRY